ncbi:MAG: hypothetical protein K8T25_17020 [Planctomycetia bacterium]|nr:hypothetical protein [Planctomycetia bacterium]
MKTLTTIFMCSLSLAVAAQAHAATNALDEVNAVRVKRGLPKFVPDEELSKAAAKCADYRAAHLIAGHTSNDFSFVPAGSSASAAGCAAWSPQDGWGACCTYENFKVAGAAWSQGRDGRRYMHLFVRGGGGGDSGSSSGYSSSGRGRRGRR